MSIKMQKKFSTKSLQNETEPQLKTAPDREQPARRRYVPSDFFAVWVTIWVNPKSKRIGIIFSRQHKRKVPDFLRNQELFGGDYWTRTSDLLRVKIRLDGIRHAFESFPILFEAVCWRLRIHPDLTAPLFPPRFFLFWVRIWVTQQISFIV